MHSVQIPIAPGVNLEMVLIPNGHFFMGSDNAFFSESPCHEICIARSFYLGKFPVTQSQWTSVMGTNPSRFAETSDLPVNNVSWDQAVEYCHRISKQACREIRLPSESEWECACRAGTEGDFHFGEWGPFQDESEIFPEVRHGLFEHAWFDLNSNDRTHPVGLKKPNAWGLYDMLGNVWEWCADVWHGDFNGAPADGSPWLDGADQQPRRSLRGGAWDVDAFRCRSPYRSYDHRDLATSRFGLRVAMDCV